MRRLLLLGTLAALAACSEPNTAASQRQTQAQKAPDTAKVAPASGKGPLAAGFVAGSETQA